MDDAIPTFYSIRAWMQTQQTSAARMRGLQSVHRRMRRRRHHCHLPQYWLALNLLERERSRQHQHQQRHRRSQPTAAATPPHAPMVTAAAGTRAHDPQQQQHVPQGVRTSLPFQQQYHGATSPPGYPGLAPVYEQMMMMTTMMPLAPTVQPLQMYQSFPQQRAQQQQQQQQPATHGFCHYCHQYHHHDHYHFHHQVVDGGQHVVGLRLPLLQGHIAHPPLGEWQQQRVQGEMVRTHPHVRRNAAGEQHVFPAQHMMLASPPPPPPPPPPPRRADNSGGDGGSGSGAAQDGEW
ncbi:hypothetical protein PTSG_10869 [Salpingoeca rosetta]|uniref:Uncharacterized protein n=1 Tax=Salpingoeca rosetta (strain ATCC 50818 / BSB-021) TaxID=946362 RepID=F2UR87_SALR5|nr:uncharacterized protein PTSG_10869 [Salpingoeca rosetta]EGD80190.1 hypothetical protein PTSG_10869 [Salpingoeca rosetta]|eukprot:XP_004988252.1 hypothetical protein PTSG_10869 [Salpingoeca rosetta]